MRWCDVLRRNAAYYSKEVALVRGSKEVTFCELDERANRVARFLVSVGIAPGDRISIVSHNALEFAEIQFGAWKAGASVAPVNFRSKQGEIEHCVGFAGAKILFVHRAYLENVPPAGHLDRLEKVICFSDDGKNGKLPAGIEAYEEVLSDHSEKEIVIPGLEEDDEAFLIFTSGSTGDPKAISSTHRMQTANASCFAYEFEIKGPDNSAEANDATLMVTPLYHQGAMTFMLSHFMVGARTVIFEDPSFDASVCLKAMSLEKISCIYMPNRAWLLILSLPDVVEHDLEAGRNFILGSESVPLALIEKMQKAFPKVRISNVYGLSETSGCSVLYLRHKDARKVPSVGKPFVNVWVRVVDNDGKDVAPGAVGEIIIKGDQVVKAYHKNPGQTAESFRNGWFYTGDLATVDEEGFVTIAGRTKDMYISGGENIYPLEIEECLFDHPKILEAAVVAIPDETWGEAGVAVIALRPGEEMTDSEVIAYLNGLMARYKVPKEVVFMEALPRTTTGKVQKPALRKYIIETEPPVA
jgi:fatty-acyl-CoA synthase